MATLKCQQNLVTFVMDVIKAPFCEQGDIKYFVREKTIYRLSFEDDIPIFSKQASLYEKPHSMLWHGDNIFVATNQSIEKFEIHKNCPLISKCAVKVADTDLKESIVQFCPSRDYLIVETKRAAEEGTYLYKVDIKTMKLNFLGQECEQDKNVSKDTKNNQKTSSQSRQLTRTIGLSERIKNLVIRYRFLPVSIALVALAIFFILQAWRHIFLAYLRCLH